MFDFVHNLWNICRCEHKLLLQFSTWIFTVTVLINGSITITSFLTSSLVVKHILWTMKQRIIKGNKLSRSSVFDTQTTCMRCSKYLCILNSRAGWGNGSIWSKSWTLGKWKHIMIEREGEEPCKILLCLQKLPPLPLSPAGQGTKKYGFHSPREIVPGEELQRTKPVKVSSCLYSFSSCSCRT